MPAPESKSPVILVGQQVYTDERKPRYAFPS